MRLVGHRSTDPQHAHSGYIGTPQNRIIAGTVPRELDDVRARPDRAAAEDRHAVHMQGEIAAAATAIDVEAPESGQTNVESLTCDMHLNGMERRLAMGVRPPRLDV